MSLFGLVAGIFTIVTFIVKLIKNFLVKYVTHAIIIAFQFTITATTIAFTLMYFGFVITMYVTLYNSGISFINYLSHPDSSLACFMSVLSCSGVTDALNNGLTMLFASFVPLMVFHLIKFTFGAMNLIKNEIFKLGVLIGQALD